MKNQKRIGITLVEVLIVIAIIAIFLGLVIGAVIKAKTFAAGIEDKNKLKKIGLGVHNYAATNNGLIPGYILITDAPTQNLSLFAAIFPYIGCEDIYIKLESTDLIVGFKEIDALISKNDISYSRKEKNDTLLGPSSFAYNMFSLIGAPRIGSSFLDGTSQTICATEHNFISMTPGSFHSYWSRFRYPLDPSFGGPRNASFADPIWGDVLPITEGYPPKTRPSIPGLTFQVAPLFQNSKAIIPQAFQPTGLKCVMFDGSVRVLHPGINESPFWALVTPSAGEAVSD
jgi:hypothetical protein